MSEFIIYLLLMLGFFGFITGAAKIEMAITTNQFNSALVIAVVGLLSAVIGITLASGNLH